MKSCLIIINNNAGGSKRISFDKVEKCLGTFYKYYHLNLPTDKPFSLNGYDAVAVCGGDGTFSTLLNKVYDKNIEFYYFPVGTLNDKAKDERYGSSKRDCIECNTKKNTINFDMVEQHLSSNNEPKKELKQADKTIENAISPDFEKSLNSPHIHCNKTVIGEPIIIGKANHKTFTYVVATGSFTPIGYRTKPHIKKKIGVFAYIGNVFREYKPHFINAEINCDGRLFKGNFTLIMYLKSARCFGFHFNYGFNEKKESGHIVAIKSPKHKGILGKIEMFFPFFRVFFVGLKKEREGKITYRKIKQSTLTVDPKTIFCQDGEKESYNQPIEINFEKTTCNVSIIDKFE